MHTLAGGRGWLLLCRSHWAKHTHSVPRFICSSQQPWPSQTGWWKLKEQQNDSLKSRSYYQSQGLHPGKGSPGTTPSSTTLQFIQWLFHLLFIINDSSFLEPETASLIVLGPPSHPATLICLRDEVSSSAHSSLQNVVNKHFIHCLLGPLPTSVLTRACERSGFLSTHPYSHLPQGGTFWPQSCGCPRQPAEIQPVSP